MTIFDRLNDIVGKWRSTLHWKAL